MAKLRVIIIGAGLAGPLLANGLLRAGVTVNVYEKLKRDDKRDGYQIRIAQPSFAGFEANLDRQKVQRIFSKMGHFGKTQKTTPILYNTKFEPLFDFGRISSQYTGSAPMDRVILRDILMETPLEAGIVHHNKAFLRYEVVNPGRGDEFVRAFFEDGTTADCDLLIGADGSHSKVNAALGLKNIDWIPYITMIAKGDLKQGNLLKLPQEARNSPVAVYSHGKCFFCVAYMPQNEMENEQAKATDPANYDESTSTFTFAMILPKSIVPKDVQTMGKDAQWKVIADLVKDWNPKYTQVLGALEGQALHVFQPRASKRPALNWRSQVKQENEPALGNSRVWLLGDSMHVMLPNRGMGGNQAMLDTTKMLPLIQRLNKIAGEKGMISTADITAACKEFEDEMIPRAFYWVEQSGGFSGVPFDTNTFSGTLTVAYLRWSANLRDVWRWLSGLFGLS